MAGYKRPYPDSWGPGYYPPGDRPPPPSRPYGDNYYSRAPWPGYYPDRPRHDYPPPRDYYGPPKPATDDYYPSPAPPRHGYGPDPPPPKREYDPRPPSYSMGKDSNRPPTTKPEKKEEDIDFTDDYSAIYGNKQSNNNRGGGGQTRGHRGRGFSRWDNPKPKHESNKPAQGQSSGQGQFGNTKPGQFSSQGKGQDSGGHQGQGRGGFQGQSRGRGNDRGHGRGNDRGRGSDRGQGRGGRGSFRGSGSDRGRGRGRGMPPSHFGSRGRGRGKPSNVPPVHSLAKAKTTLMDVAAMSTPEKLHRFCLYVKEDRNQKGNSIQTITNAITSSKLGLKIEFEPSGLAWVSNTKVTTGTLTLDGVFLARSIGMSKKELKMSVFDKALDVMKTKTVAEIYNLKDEGPDYFRDQILGDLRDKDMDDKKGPAPSENESPLVKLVNYVKSKPADSHDNAISFIEQACAQFCFLTSYKFEFQSATNILHKGKFTYDDIVLATGHGESKKKCKKSVYEEVFRRLTTCTIEELKESVPEPDLEEIVATHKKGTPKLQIRDKPLEQRLEEFLTGLKSKTASSNSPVSTIDVIAKSCGLYAMLIFKPTTDMKLCLSTKCDLYIENIYISSGQAVKKKDSILPAYLKAFEILTITTAEELLDETKFRRLRDEELHDPKSKDILFKGTGKTLESNLENLTRNGYDTDNLTNTMEDDFVIVEHHGWSVERTKHAFMILQHSCSQNGLFLQWQSEPVMTHNTYKCIVFINGKEVSSSYGFGRLHSKSLACMEALYKLYETYDAILINQYEEIKDYMDYTMLKNKVAELRMSGITPVSSLKVDEEETNLVDPYFSTLIQQLLDDLKARNKDDDDLEIRIGPGFSPSEWLEVKYRVRAMDMRYWIQHKNDGEQEEVFIIMKKIPWKDLARILKNREGNICGKYELLVGDKKPKYSEVKDLIMKEFAALQDPNLKDVKHLREVIMSKKEKKKAAKNKTEFEAINAEQDLQMKTE